MGLDVWFAEDIRRALAAADAASALTALEAAWSPGVDAVALRSFRRGYKVALGVVALAFGVGPGLVTAGQDPGAGAVTNHEVEGG